MQEVHLWSPIEAVGGLIVGPQGAHTVWQPYRSINHSVRAKMWQETIIMLAIPLFVPHQPTNQQPAPKTLKFLLERKNAVLYTQKTGLWKHVGSRLPRLNISKTQNINNIVNFCWFCKSFFLWRVSVTLSTAGSCFRC